MEVYQAGNNNQGFCSQYSQTQKGIVWILVKVYKNHSMAYSHPNGWVYAKIRYYFFGHNHIAN